VVSKGAANHLDAEPYPPPQITPGLVDDFEPEPYPLPDATLVDDGSERENNLTTPLESSRGPHPVPDPDIPQKGTFSNFVYLPVIFHLPVIFRPYNRVAAVAHADQFAHVRSSEYPNFGTGCACNDCTNYVSQSLHKGGLPLKTGSWDPNSPFEWWYKRVLWWWENSNTWSATDWFNTYLFQYPTEFELRSWPTELETGDFFILDLHGAKLEDPPDGIPDHVRFVVGKGYSSVDPADYACQQNPIPQQTFGLLANQHCVDRKHVLWNYNLEDFGNWSFHVVDSIPLD
jgi:hypothetical protein